MLDKAITDFLENKKEEWLAKEIKPKTKEDKIKELKKEADDHFSRSWLEKIINNLSNSKDIVRLKYTTHAPKFSHPDVKLNALNFNPQRITKSLVATGSVSCVNLDMYSNSGAAYLKKDYIYVYEFLIRKLPDERMIIEHLDRSTDEIKAIFSHLNISKSFSEVRESLLGLLFSNEPEATSEKIKQIYFPVNDHYHLLSLLLPSPVMSEFKTRINLINFSKTNKEARQAVKDKKQLKSEVNEVFGLTKIGYGGANKQNISVLNNKGGGYFYLLASLPPTLEKRQTQPPKTDFFNDCLWGGLFKSDFEQFHNVLSWRKNNKDVRDMRDDIVLNSIAKLKRLTDNIREIGDGWSDSETYGGLVRWQKIWLDEQYAEIRQDDKQNQDYLVKVQSYFANWFIGNYKQSTKDNKLLGDDDIAQIKKILKQEQELLK